MSFPKYGDDYYSDFFEKKFLLKKGKVWVVYCIVNPKNEIYVGHSSDIRNRLTSHNTGGGAVLTKGRGPWEVFHLQLVENRQDAVKQLALENEFMIVVGSKNSSNSNRLKELSDRCGCEAILIDEFNDLDLEKIKNINKIAITAGASAPEDRVQEIALALRDFTGGVINEIGKDEENIVFKMPPELRKERVK